MRCPPEPGPGSSSTPPGADFPRCSTSGGDDDPRAQWADAALDADVMLIRAGDEHFAPGSPGLRFIDWINNGHYRYGWPTVGDLDYHLTTLFFEVRARGFLELRAGEAVPDALRPAQVVLATALFYDEAARAEAISLLADQRADLNGLWRRAATHGVHDDVLKGLACRLWEIALAGAQRLPAAWIGEENLAAATRLC